MADTLVGKERKQDLRDVSNLTFAVWSYDRAELGGILENTLAKYNFLT